MIRFSILDNQDRFDKALQDIYPKIKENISSEDIITSLRDKYQEVEMKKLIKWIKERNEIPQYDFLLKSLKYSIWILIIFRLFEVILFVSLQNYSGLLSLFFIFVAPLFLIIALFLINEGSPLNFFIIFTFSILGLRSLPENIEALFEHGIISYYGLYIIPMNILLLWVAISSIRLHKIFSHGRYKTNIAIKRLKLE